MKRDIGEDGRHYLATLPSIDNDPDFWEKCGPCAQDTKKCIAYSECSDCDHLNTMMLRDICNAISCAELQMEANSGDDCGMIPVTDPWRLLYEELRDRM